MMMDKHAHIDGLRYFILESLNRPSNAAVIHARSMNSV